ncbi:hypothetical protein K3495_g13283 [Podosphaera aphanis]|nr:hypothetical protein K3495_g13283 [Podosphaera aphanis]
MRWASPCHEKIPPPLLHEGRLVSDQEERASILRDNLLARHQASDDLPPTILTGETKIPWTEELSEIEVRKCTIGSGNTSAGADGISVELLSACWDSIGTHITQLFHACIRLGYHPSCFKLAEIVLLPKPGRDLTSVKGWRLIALLSCLAKGLERVVAKRMSFLAVTSDIVGSQQFGALPKRSANDPVSCVVHDIEEARSQGWASTFVTLDVQGAFDAVLHNRLLSRMKTQGWPEQILRWTASFLSDRLVQVRFPGGVSCPKNLVCGVPQGSPISPLLFLLYLAEPMRSGNTRARFSYADDIGILGFGRTINESAAAAQDKVNSLLKWANDNAVAFDIEKSEVVQFSGRHREEPVGIQIGHTRIEPAEHIRWLGVYLDSRLSFKHHVATWCGKALKVAHHMRRLNPVLRGAAPSPLVAAVSSCVVPVATFGADVWWPGLTRPTARGNVTPPTTPLCSLIDKSVHLALRAALPVWRTTPNVVLHRESGIPPARMLLEGIRLRPAARLNTLDDRHPLRSRASVCPNVGILRFKASRKLSKRPEIKMTRIQRAYRQLPSSKAAESLSAPAYSSNLGSKSEGVEAHLKWIQTIASSDICAYSDGSSEGHGRSSWGFVLKRGGQTFKKSHGILHGGEVYDAEIVGATMALRAALLARQEGQRIYVL